MKTKNNVQKTVLRSVAVVVSFVLISITVSAQDFWKKLLENSSFNKIAIAMVETTNEADSPEFPTTPTNSALFYEESESELLLENWMIDESNFNVPVFQPIEEMEDNLEIEDWMLDENVFSDGIDFEKTMELEAWMTSEKVWKI